MVTGIIWSKVIYIFTLMLRFNETNGCFLLSINEVKIKLRIINSEFSIIDGWYCPEFGKKFRNKVIKIISTQVPVTLSYHIYLG